MPNLILIGHLEKAPESSGKTLLGYTLSVGLSPLEKETVIKPGYTGTNDPLLPWTWSRKIDRFQLWKCINGEWTQLKGADGRPKPFDVRFNANWEREAHPGKLDNLRKALGDRYAEGKTDIAWKGVSSGIANPEPIKVESGKDRGLSWPAQVTDLSTAPYPLAQLLNLSFAFEVDTKDLEVPGTNDAIALVPVPARALSSDTFYMYSASFQSGQNARGGYGGYNDTGFADIDRLKGIEVLAECNLVFPNATPDTGEFDQRTQRIPMGVPSFVDWQKRFLESCPRLFSLPAFIDFAIRTVPLETAALRGMWGTLAESGIAAMRDLCGMGDIPGPAGISLLEALGINTEGLPAGFEDAFNSKVALAQQEWKAILQKASPAVSALAALQESVPLTDPKQADPSLDAPAVREWQRLYALFEHEERGAEIDAIYLEQWKQVLANTSATQAAREALLRQISDALRKAQASISRPKALLDGLAGLYWRQVLDLHDTGPNPYLQSLKQLAQDHVFSRLGFNVKTAGFKPRRSAPLDWLPKGAALARWQGDVQKLLTPVWGQWWLRATAGFEARTDPIPGDEDEAQNPQAVHLAFTRPVSLDEHQKNESADFFRDIRGVGVLARRRAENTWYCLNRNGLADAKGEMIFRNPVGFAIRPTYGPAVRNCLLDYNDEPLAGGSPLAQVAGIRNPLDGDKDARDHLLQAHNHDAVEVLATRYGRAYQYVSFGAMNSGILPAAVRVDDVRAWLAKVPHDSSDELFKNPAEIVYQRIAPVGALRINRDSAVESKLQHLPDIPDQVSPRARDLDWGTLWKAFQKQEESQRAKKILTGPEIIGLPDGAQLPLVLLSPSGWVRNLGTARNRYQFLVQLPRVHWKLWDRWIVSLLERHDKGRPASDLFPRTAAAINPIRQDVIASCLAAAVNGGNVENRQPLPSIDDPAVDRWIYVELLRESGGTLQAADGSGQFVKVANPEKATGVDRYSSSAARIICHHGGTAASRVEKPDNAAEKPEINAWVKGGDVCALRIYCCIPAEYQVNDGGEHFPMFHDNLVPAGQQHHENPENQREYILASPYTMLLEGATEEMPTAEDLYAALNLGYRIAAGKKPKRLVVASFQPGADLRFLHVGSAGIREQIWRWDGRPAPLHPVLDSSPLAADGYDKDWIARAYGGTQDIESGPEEMPLARQDPKKVNPNWRNLYERGCRSFEHTVDLRESSAQGVKGGEKGAHYRFAVRPRSRYDALIPEQTAPRSGIAAMPAGFKGTDGEPDLAFKSIFIPSQVAEPLPVPRLRFVLPLTEGYQVDSEWKPGLLAVFDDVWYDQAGLGEGLRASVDIVHTGGTAEVKPVTYHVQFGRDFQLRMGSGTQTMNGFQDLKQPPAVIDMDSSKDKVGREHFWAGPVGHFRDRSSSSTKFLGSSFIIPAPSRPLGQPALDTRWWFASLKFKRTLVTRIAPEPSDTATPAEFNQADIIAKWGGVKVLESESTDPYWVQLLPEFSIFDSAGGLERVGNLIPQCTVNGAELRLLSRETRQAVELRATATAEQNAFRLYAVLTMRAYDFRGLFNQEVYAGVYVQDDADKKIWRGSIYPGVPKLEKDYRVRVIEVQLPTAADPNLRPTERDKNGRPWPTDPERIWDALFEVRHVDPADTEGGEFRSAYDARGRITRISEPADSEGRERCELEAVQ